MQVLQALREPVGLFFAEGRLQDFRPVELQPMDQGFPVPRGPVGVDRPQHDPLGEESRTVMPKLSTLVISAGAGPGCARATARAMAATCEALVDKKRPFPSLLSHGQKHTHKPPRNYTGPRSSASITPVHPGRSCARTSCLPCP